MRSVELDVQAGPVMNWGNVGTMCFVPAEHVEDEQITTSQLWVH
eukprot:COSAG02_NODE_55306_length_291_cov_0.802083_1_plen_43_part_10